MNLTKLLTMLGKTAEAVGKQKVAKYIKKSGAEDMKLAILKNIDEATKSIQQGGGFTIDPRTGKMVILGEQFGHMMSPIKNENAVQIPFKQDVTREEILNAIPPEYIPRLQRGANLGGWVQDEKIYIDPAERYITKLMALKKGLKSEQLSGTDLKIPLPENWDTDPSPFYDVTPEAYKNLLRKRALQTLLITGTPSAAGYGLVKLRDN